MKKLFAILLAVTLVASMATVVSATSTTTLTTTVPAASYTLNIPADQKINYGATETEIGKLTVTGAEGFAQGKNLAVTVTYDAFKCDDTSTTIPIDITSLYTGYASAPALDKQAIASGTSLVFAGDIDGGVDVPEIVKGDYHYFLDCLILNVDSADWGKALAGDYTATITFTAEVVAE